MLRRASKLLGPRTQQRAKGAYIPPGGRSLLPRRVPRKLRVGETRPAIYYKFEQVVELSDGSTVTRRTVFPRAEVKYLADQRNTPLWNPSQPDLRAIELDASGKLARFKQKFGQSEEIDLDELVSDGAEQVTTGRLHVPSKKKKK